jgi:formylglycine-generating enzyme required for sulfatase activity
MVLRAPGVPGTTAVGTFPANGHGAYDMIGNVWEWTSSPYVAADESACARRRRQARSWALKGGSYLRRRVLRALPASGADRSHRGLDHGACRLSLRGVSSRGVCW